MQLELLTGLAVFSFVSSITPGPNNLMLMASGANFGFRRTIPHMLGVGIGFVFMITMVGIGLVGFFTAVPESYLVLKALSIVYLLYLAGRIATAARPGEETDETGCGLSVGQPESLDDGFNGDGAVRTDAESRCGADCCSGVWRHQPPLCQRMDDTRSATAGLPLKPAPAPGF